MDLLIVSSYYNNPHFIKFQKKSFDNINNNYDFVILNDAREDTKSLLSNLNSKQEIYEESKKYNIKNFFIPQEIHENISRGGLVPDGLPANHPTERHRAVLNYFFQNIDKFITKKYKYLLIADSDLFLKENIDILTIMNGFDMGGQVIKSKVKRDPNDKNQFWPEKYKDISEEIDIVWIQPIFLVIDIYKLYDKFKFIDIGGFSGTDSGGMLNFFIKEYNIKLKSIPQDKNIELQYGIGECDSKNIYIHYYGGSNWSYENEHYYYEKLYRMFKIEFPKFFTDLEYKNVDKNLLVSYDKSHKFI